MYAVNIQNLEEEKEHKIKDSPVLMEFKDAFPKEILGLLPKRDLYFSIELVSGEVLVSKDPYWMSRPEVVKLKLKLQELIENDNTRPSVSAWGSRIIFCEK